MATRSTIAMEHANGTIEQIYCHWDGYLNNNGKILLEHYSNPVKVKQLLAEGDLSSLGREIGEKHEFDNPYKWGTDEYAAHRAKYKHMCLFYGRDRGEQNIGKRIYKDFSDYLRGQSEEYNYILIAVGEDRHPMWFVSYNETDGKFVKLTEAISQEEWNNAVE